METAVITVLLLYYCITAVRGTVNIDCNDGQFYIRKDPESCNHFYKCDNGNPVKFTCPDGLYYNPNSHVCDWPRNVNCDWVKSPGNNGNSGQQSQQYNDNNGQYYDNNGQYDDNNGQYYDNDGQYSDDNGQYSDDNGQYNDGNNYRPPNDQNVDPYQDQADQSQDDESFMYPYQIPEQTESAPSINIPDGLDENRPRPTIDDMYTSNPYAEYTNGNNNNNPDIDPRK